MVRNDAFPASEIAARIADYDGVLLSPGPGTPADAGVSVETVHAAIAADKPLLGVCLGHQAIAEALGATVTHAEELMHGKTSQVDHDDSALFAGVPHPFTATRYHSLAIVDGTVPDELTVTARTRWRGDHGRAAPRAPVYGVQFHPESVLTEGGYRMVGNWLETTGLGGAAERAAALNPLIAARRA